jgi:hypothetical protein
VWAQGRSVHEVNVWGLVQDCREGRMQCRQERIALATDAWLSVGQVTAGMSGASYS